MSVRLGAGVSAGAGAGDGHGVRWGVSGSASDGSCSSDEWWVDKW